MTALGEWTFLTNYTHVLLVIAEEPDIRLRDVAERVGITERGAQRIVRELANEGYLQTERIGRRNRYAVMGDHPLRHPMEQHHSVGELIQLLSSNPVTAR